MKRTRFNILSFETTSWKVLFYLFSGDQRHIPLIHNDPHGKNATVVQYHIVLATLLRHDMDRILYGISQLEATLQIPIHWLYACNLPVILMWRHINKYFSRHNFLAFSFLWVYRIACRSFLPVWKIYVYKYMVKLATFSKNRWIKPKSKHWTI